MAVPCSRTGSTRLMDSCPHHRTWSPRRPATLWVLMVVDELWEKVLADPVMSGRGLSWNS